MPRVRVGNYRCLSLGHVLECCAEQGWPGTVLWPRGNPDTFFTATSMTARSYTKLLSRYTLKGNRRVVRIIRLDMRRVSLGRVRGGLTQSLFTKSYSNTT